MNLPPLDQLKKLQAEATPGPWGETPHLCIPQEEGVNSIVAYRDGTDPESDFMYLGDLPDNDTPLVALAPELLAEVIRLREALEKQLNGINLVIAMADMIQPQTEAQQTAITLARDLCDDLTRILEGEANV